MRIAALLALAVATPAFAADLKIVPSGGVVLSQANHRGYYDLVVDNVVVASGAHETIQLRSVRIELLRGDQVMATRTLPAEALVANTAGIAEAGFPGALESQLLNDGGLAGLFGRPVSLASAAELAPSTALIASGVYFAVNFQPDTVRVVADYGHGARTISETAPVAQYVSPIAYRSPVAGVWYQRSLPTLLSHHRLNPSTAFAVDFFKINETGDIFTGDERDVRNFPGFGAPVMAAADGVVVQAIGDEVQDREAMLPRPDETEDQAWERIGQYMMGRMTQDFRRAAAGNLVVIRHDVAGRVEYSAYAHLRAASLRVHVGQTVRQGEVIAEVGDTGDTTNVHLHFQINAGPDPFASQSLPVTFSDTPEFPDELGRLIVVAPRDQH